MDKNDEYVSIAEAAQLLSVHYSTVFAYIKRHAWTTTKRGRKTYVRRADVMHQVDDLRIDGPAAPQHDDLTHAIVDTLRHQLDNQADQIKQLQERNRELHMLLAESQQQVKRLLPAPAAAEKQDTAAAGNDDEETPHRAWWKRLLFG